MAFVYILSNPTIHNLIKIGMTTRSVEQRAAELNSTGVAAPFCIEWYIETKTDESAFGLERASHQYFAKWRLPNREFFEVSREDAIDYITTTAHRMNIILNPPIDVAERIRKQEQRELNQRARLEQLELEKREEAERVKAAQRKKSKIDNRNASIIFVAVVVVLSVWLVNVDRKKTETKLLKENAVYVDAFGRKLLTLDDVKAYYLSKGYAWEFLPTEYRKEVLFNMRLYEELQAETNSEMTKHEHEPNDQEKILSQEASMRSALSSSCLRLVGKEIREKGYVFSGYNAAENEILVRQPKTDADGFYSNAMYGFQCNLIEGREVIDYSLNRDVRSTNISR